MKPRNKRVDPAKAKAKKQKKILIGMLVVLFALGAFQLPKLMKGSKAPAEAAPAAPAATTSSDPAATAAAPSATAQPVAVPAVPVTLSDARGPSASDGQLVSFSLFKGKDPFQQQLDPAEQSGDEGTKYSNIPPNASGTGPATTGKTTTPPSTTGSGTTPATTEPSSTPPVSTPPASEPPASTPPVTEPPATTPPVSEPPISTPPASTPPSSGGSEPPAEKPKAPTSATISVNGTAESVSIGASFPKAEPLFSLVSIKDGAARIGIAGGTLQGQTQTVPLVKGKTLTLMNTADGMRYVLRLVSLS